jgi:hypothetical protein
MVRVSSLGITTDNSLEKKSSLPIVATSVLDSVDHLPMRWGWVFA